MTLPSSESARCYVCPTDGCLVSCACPCHRGANQPVASESAPSQVTAEEQAAWDVLQLVHDAEFAKRTWGETAASIAARLTRLVSAAKRANDEEWLDRARRYFDGIRDPYKLLAHYAPGAVLADVVMHEVWKRDPNVIEAKREGAIEALEGIDPFGAYCGADQVHVALAALRSERDNVSR